MPPSRLRRGPWLVALAAVAAAPPVAAQDGGAAGPPAITFNKNFEGGALGTVERLGPGRFRLHVEGQQDEHGRNRLANWYYFRLDGVKGRDLTLTLTDLVGEYYGRPGACAFSADTVPVFSNDGVSWQHVPALDWDNARKEATLHLHPAGDTVWVAHVPPYTPRRLRRLLDDVGRRPHAVVEVIGRTAQGRDLHLVTVTNPDVPDAGKKVVWLIAREHAWEAGTSYVLEGALRFLVSDDRAARGLRDRVVFRLVPMVDPDGCAAGRERFNANGYDVNRHWDEVDLRHPEFLRKMPEIWYVKKAVLGSAEGKPIDLLVNLHNTESAEYLDTQAADGPAHAALGRLFARLVANTTFDPSVKELRVRREPAGTTNWLFRERGIPAGTLEQRIGLGGKLGRRATVADRVAFGRQLVEAMAGAVGE
jgi:hypothetical protein